MERKEKVTLWTRALIYFLLLIVPPIYLMVRYHLFTEVSKLSLGGWGILCVALIVFGLCAFLKSVVSGVYAYWKQVVKGVIYILLPFACVYFIVWLSQEHIRALMEFLIISMFSYFFAYIINPYPQWNLKKVDERNANVLNSVLDKRSKNV